MVAPFRVRLMLVALMLGALFAPVNRTQASSDYATINVPCSASALIAAINAANTSPEADILNLQAGCPYILSSVNNTMYGPNGLPAITSEITINGNGATIEFGYTTFLPVVIRAGQVAGSATASQPNIVTGDPVSLQSESSDGAHDFRIIMVASGGSLTLNAVTLGGGHLTEDYGGAIFNAGALIVINSTITGNSASVGGGIYNIGTLTISGSTFSFNTAEGAGGGISSSGVLRVSATLFSGNTAILGDGYFVADGESTVINITFHGDTAYETCPSFPYNVPAGDTAKIIEAMHCANSTPVDDVINLAAGSTYTFTAADNSGLGFGATALPLIADAAVAGKITINGSGATIARSSAEGTPEFRILMTNSGSNLTLNTLTMLNGLLSSGAGGGISNNGGTLAINNSQLQNNGAQFGGGIQANGGVLTITGSVLSGNYTTARDGAAIVGSGTITVNNSLFTGNRSEGLGGGILVNGGTLTVTGSTFSNNLAKAPASGAALLVSSWGAVKTYARVSGCTFTGNHGNGGGGAVFLTTSTETTITNSTFTANSAQWGGAIANNGVLALEHSTISLNSAVQGGGIDNTPETGRIVSLWHTIVAGNSATNNGPDIAGPVDSRGYNIIGSTSGAAISGTTTGNLTGAAAAPLNFGPLKDNGGPTQTMALAAGSVAIDAGDPAIPTAPEFDQRGAGFPRIHNGRIDIGAYESGDGFACPASPYTVPAGNTAALIGAINCANASASNDVINLTNSTYTFSAANNDGQGNGPTALPLIADAAVAGTLTIHGNGATLARSSTAGTPEFRIFLVNNGGNLTLNTLTLQNGSLSTNNGAGVFVNFGALAIHNSVVMGNSAQYGGGIANESGTLTVTSTTFSANASPHDGAAINSAGTTTVSNSIFTNNTAEGLGGGILVPEGTLTVTNSSFTGNIARQLASGAGILVASVDTSPVTQATISGCTFADNGGGGAGGAVFAAVRTNTTITNSTFTHNDAQNGGALWNGGVMTVSHSTIVANVARGDGGGIYMANPEAILSLSHTIVVGNTASNASPEIYGTVVSQGYNLIGSTSGATISGTSTGNHTGVTEAQVNLGVLQNNGGPTTTMALGTGSIAVNAGNPAIPDAPEFDQRGTGFLRIKGARIDIGAYESDW